jgi:hypothetical protein
MKSIRLFISVIAIAALFVFVGCSGSPKNPTKGETFPKMYEDQPRSVLILPPMNESTDAEAKDYYMTTVEVPFAMAGYYTFPVEMVSDIMKQEGVYDTEILYNMPLAKFYEYFGADTVLFTHIKKWDVAYAVVASTLTVSIEARLLSTKTSEELWRYEGSVRVDLSGGNSSGSIEGLIVNAIATAINTASADYVKYAHIVNANMIYTLPAGPYSAMHMQDQGMLLNPNRR